MKLLVSVVFSGLSELVIEGVEAVGGAIVVRATTRGGAVACPECATPTTRLHAYHQRVPADIPLDGRRVLLRVRVRRMCCDASDCSGKTFRELGLALNTVKRYARADAPERIQRVPKYRPTLVDPYRAHLRARRTKDPGAPTQQLLREIRDLGYQSCSNLLVRYLNQGRHLDDQPHLSPRRATRLLLTRPQALTDEPTATRDRIVAVCPEMTDLATLIGSFAALLRPADGNDDRLRQWITDTRGANLPHLHSFTRALEQDFDAVVAALTLPHHNGRTEGVNTKTKLLKRQTYGRASFKLLRHRILIT